MASGDQAATDRDTAAGPTPSDWPDQVFARLKAAGITQVAIVPDAGHARLIKLCEKDDPCAWSGSPPRRKGWRGRGAWLGGARGVLLMQSSGVGNCINMLTLPIACQFPLLMLSPCAAITANSTRRRCRWATRPRRCSEAMGVIVKRADTPEDVAKVARRRSLSNLRPGCAADRPARARRQGVRSREMSDARRTPLHRREVVKALRPGAGICWWSPGWARPPGTSPMRATTSSIFRCGAGWARRRWSASAWRWRSPRGGCSS